MSIREVTHALDGPSCHVCGSIMARASHEEWKCLSCGATAPTNAPRSKEPQSPSLAFDSAKQYGLLSGGPTVNFERCAKMLKRGKELGYSPAPLQTLIAKCVGRQ